LRIKLVDVSSAALCNAFRYNYGEVEGCSMLLDIGAKTSNLLFFEKGKVYARSINLGANSITQDYAHEAKTQFPEAESAKLEKGSVSLGGAYEEPEDAQAAAIAKIARQVMTRLHIQVNQTIQFYRGQQGGSVPERLYLSGGASIMPYTAQFFAEKLNLPVDYFNPFKNIDIDPAVDLEELSKHAHSFGEVVGLGLRDLAHCPVELNLMPKSSIQRQEFARKKPYLIAAIFSLALAVFLLDQAEGRIYRSRHATLDKEKSELEALDKTDKALSAAIKERNQTLEAVQKVIPLSENHYYWIKLVSELRKVMIAAEKSVQPDLQKLNDGQEVDTGVWVEKFAPILPSDSPYGAVAAVAAPVRVDPRQRGARSAGPVVAAATLDTNAISLIRMTCQLVDRSKISGAANQALAFAVQSGLNASPYFTNADFGGKPIQADVDDTNLFNFELTVGLKQPFKL
jgi:type IV pilus assembly protein PilM